MNADDCNFITELEQKKERIHQKQRPYQKTKIYRAMKTKLKIQPSNKKKIETKED